MDGSIHLCSNRNLSKSELELEGCSAVINFIKSELELEDSSAVINAVMVPPEGPQEDEKPGDVCPLLGLPKDVMQFILLKQDARGQTRSRSLCHTLSEIFKNQVFRSQRDKLAPSIEPVHIIVYLTKIFRDVNPQAWDAKHNTWRPLPSLDFLPPGSVKSESKPSNLSCSAPGLLFFQHVPMPTNSVKLDKAGGGMEDKLCVCNPLTREAVFMPLPPSREGRTPDDPIVGLFAPWKRLESYILLHTGSGPGFTLYDLSEAPTLQLFKLQVDPEQAAPLTISMDGLEAYSTSSRLSELVPLGKGIMQSTAQWTPVNRPIQDDDDLMLYAEPILMDGVIRTLCLGKINGDRYHDYQAVFVDYNIDKEEWEEVEVRGVPVISDLDFQEIPEHGHVSLVRVLGDNARLWLLQKYTHIGVEDSDSEDDQDVESEEQTRSSTRSRKRKLALDLYVYKPQDKAFVYADTICVPAARTHILAQALGGASTSTIDILSMSPSRVLRYDLVTRKLSLVTKVLPDPGYCPLPVAGNFQLSPAPLM